LKNGKSPIEVNFDAGFEESRVQDIKINIDYMESKILLQDEEF